MRPRHCSAFVSVSACVIHGFSPRLAPAGGRDATREGRENREGADQRERAGAGSDLPASLEASRSNRRRISPRRRMLAGLRTRERSGFRRIPTVHRFPAPKGQCDSWRSFSLTAAGQPRILTGFPLNSGGHPRAPARDATYCTVSSLVNLNIVVSGSRTTTSCSNGPDLDRIRAPCRRDRRCRTICSPARRRRVCGRPERRLESATAPRSWEARRSATALEQRFLAREQTNAMLAEVRRFYRMDLPEKLGRIAQLA